MNIRLNSIMLMLAAMLTAAATQAAQRTVDRPQYVWSSDNGMDIESITLADTATIVGIVCSGRPGDGVGIAPTAMLTDDGGNTYPLRWADGITPGKKSRMGNDGLMRFWLGFYPVAGEARSVTLAETARPGRRGKVVAGISLSGTLAPLVLPGGVSALAVDSTAELPLPTVRYGVATVRLHLLEYQDAMDGITVKWKQDGIFLPNVSTLKRIGIDSLGCCTVTMTVAATTPVLFRVGQWGHNIICYAEADRTTDVYVSLRELSRRSSALHRNTGSHGLAAYFTGPHALLSQELTDNPNPWWSMWNQEGLEKWSMERYMAHTDSLHRGRARRWSRLPVSRAAREADALSNDFELLSNLKMATNAIANARVNHGVMSREADTGGFRDSQERIVMARIGGLGALKSLSNPKALFSPGYSFNIGSFPKELVAAAAGADSSVYLTVLETKRLHNGVFNDHVPLTSAARRDMARLPAAFREMVDAENDSLLANMAWRRRKAMGMLRKTPAAPDSLLLDSIVARYRGKVVVVDFWGTWCGNCIMNHKVMAPVRKEMEGKDVAFVYLCDGKSSPDGKWSYMAADVDGEHYKLSDSQWKGMLVSLTGKMGVPVVVFYDKRGRMDSIEHGWGSESFWRDKINGLLKE